jgi:hypothetical protein
MEAIQNPCNVSYGFQDVITDLNAEGEPLPMNPPREDWLGHKVSHKTVFIFVVQEDVMKHVGSNLRDS